MTLELLAQPETYVSLLTLTAMEVVLGIDNVVFISILTGKLPPAQQPIARRLGLSLALFAMAFSLGVELLNMRMRKKLAPVALHHRFEGEAAPAADSRPARGQR